MDLIYKMDAQTISDAYRELRHATSALSDAQLRLTVARQYLKKTEAGLINDGMILGSNVQQRDAHMLELTENEISKLQHIEREVEDLKLIRELAMLKVKEVNLLTQLYIADISPKPGS